MKQTKTDVYRNLNATRAGYPPGSVVYSIRQGGKVVGYQETALLTDVAMKHATPKALDRVRTKHREVCQWLKGTLVPCNSRPDGTWKRINCDPKTSDGFVDEDGHRIDSAEMVWLDETGCYVSETKTAVAWKYEDPIEDARWIYDADEAREIEIIDPSLLIWM